MSIAPGIVDHAVTITMPSQARSSLARIDSERNPTPSACPRAGTELDSRNLKTNAMMIPEITMGITKIVRSAVWKRIREVRQIGRASCRGGVGGGGGGW